MKFNNLLTKTDDLTINHTDDVFILFVSIIGILTTISICFPLCNVSIHLYKWIKNKYFNNNINAINNLNSNLIIYPSEDTNYSSKTHSRNNSDNLPDYNTVINY